MRGTVLAILLLALAPPARAYQYWNDARHSALLPDSTIVIRVENPAGAGIENYVLHAGSGIIEQAMTPVLDGLSTVAAVVPGPVAALRRYGFRLVQPSGLDLMPVRLADGISPAPQDLTRLAEDPGGDHLFGYQNLDLLECRVSFSGTRFFAALKNAGGGFPVSKGLTFFGYLLAIADPALADPDTVFALMQTYNQPGVITPGLYKITGPGFGNLHKIGNVSVQEFPAASSLLLSCNLADLMADPYFQSWYDPEDPELGVAGFTQRITLLGGAAEADRTPGGGCHLREFLVAPAANLLPGLTGLTLQGVGPEACAFLDYSDPNGHCPILAEIAFDEAPPHPLYPQSLDYGQPVEYRTLSGIEPLASGSWSRAVARFSDNLADTVRAAAARSGTPDDAGPARPAFQAAIHPSPFGARTNIDLAMQAPGDVRVEVFDARGALVRIVFSGVVGAGTSRFAWDGRDGRGGLAPSGPYFCRISTARQALVEKVVLLR